MQTFAPIPHPRELCESLSFVELPHSFRCGPEQRRAGGWKLYVSATSLNVGDVLTCVIDVLLRKDVSFEYVRDLETVRRLNKGAMGYEQVGRCLVIDLDHPMPGLLDELRDALVPFRGTCPRVPFARHFGDGLPLFFSYEPDDEARSDSGAVGGILHEDDQQIRADLERLVLPLRPAGDLEAFLMTYPAFAAITQKGKRGVFRAFSLRSELFQEVVLKVSYRNGQRLPDGGDGRDLLRRELAFYRSLARRGLAGIAPELEDAFDDETHVALVQERIEGVSLLELRLDGRLVPDQLEECWALIGSLHAHGLYHGDAKIASFILTEGGRLVALDFETAGVVGEDQPLPFRTFDLRNPRTSDPMAADRQHLLVSALFPYQGSSFENQDRIIDLGAVAGGRGEDDVERWALDRLRSELDRERADDR